MITANIATYSGRKDFLPKVIESLKRQTMKLDAIRVWYNDYEPENVPGIVQHFNGMDYTDRGKFIWLDNIRVTGKHEIYFSCDDDLEYPPDYVERTLEGMNRHPGKVVSYHGRRLKGENKNYYFEHQAYNFLATINEDKDIEVPGTGVTAFDTRVLIPDIIQYNDNCMADVLMALEMAKAGVKGVCLSHKRGWVNNLPAEDTIYKRHSRRCTRQSELANKVWSYCKNNV